MSQSTRTSPLVRTKTSQRQLDDDDAEKLRALGDAVERAFTKVSSARDRLNAQRKAKSMPNTPMTRASEDVVDDFMLERQGRFEQLEAAATRLDFLNIIQEDDDQKNVELAQNTITVEYNDVRQSHDKEDEEVGKQEEVAVTSEVVVERIRTLHVVEEDGSTDDDSGIDGAGDQCDVDDTSSGAIPEVDSEVHVRVENGECHVRWPSGTLKPTTCSFKHFINSLEHGQRVVFAPGVYSHIDSPIEVTKNVTFIGDDAEGGTVFDGDVIVLATRFAVKRVHFFKLYISRGDATIDHCRIHGCTIIDRGALIIGSSASCRVSNTEIYDNAGEGAAVSAKHATFDSCKIFRNTVGVSVRGTSAAKVSKCRVSDNVTYGLIIGADASGTYTDNVVCANEIGVRIEGNATPSFTRNKVEDNRSDGTQCVDRSSGMLSLNAIKQNGGSGIMFDDSCSTQAHKNEIENNKLDGVVICGKSRPTLIANRIRANVQNGVVCADQSRAMVHANKISQSVGGVVLNTDAGGNFTDNKVFENDVGVTIADDNEGTNFKIVGNEVSDNATAPLRAPSSIAANVAQTNSLAGVGGELIASESGECVVM
jgi:hypothetical protein